MRRRMRFEVRREGMGEMLRWTVQIMAAWCEAMVVELAELEVVTRGMACLRRLRSKQGTVVSGDVDAEGRCE